MCSNIDFKQACSVGAGFAVASTVTAGAAQLAGHSIGLLNGAGFGFVQGGITYVANNHMPQFLPNMLRSLPAAVVAGGLTAFGANRAAAALGFIASPISFPTAIVLTVADVAILHIFILLYGTKQGQNS